MPSADRTFDRGTRIGERALESIASEFATARRGLGASQQHVASVARVDRSRYSRLERGKAPTLQVVEVARIAAVLGLDPTFTLYPAGPPARDAAHARRLRACLADSRPPLIVRTEVALPPLPDRRELRAWDAMVAGGGFRTAIELEMRLHDVQAVERRISLKRRDDPTEHFLLLIPDTRNNRRVLDSVGWSLAGLSRLRTANVRAALEAGRHPGTGFVLV